jgi:putative phage-type endonuclease
MEQTIHASTADSLITQEVMDELLSRKQTEQRTAEWYQQSATIISASELGNLFASERQRAKFVVSKTVPAPPRFQPLATPSDYMSAFDWGIRFEPVVKQIYEHKHGVNIKELGRMHHPTDPRCTASPDGLIYSCPLKRRTGHLIEIKCPVTREIDGSVPKDYYAQMQMQLHVTGLTHCEYVEAVFSSRYNQLPLKEGPCLYDGFIAVIRYAEPVNGQDFYYAYSPVNPDSNWSPVIKEEEEMVEITPWRLYQWSEQVIVRNEEWWTGLCPMINTFWEDVEKARKGEFVIPDSTRPSKKQKTEKCMIQFHKVEEEDSITTMHTLSYVAPIHVIKMEEL